MNFLKIFHHRKREHKTSPQPFRIEGTTTHLTPRPDDAELAAQALLEMMCDGRRKKDDGRRKKRDVEPQPSNISHQPSSPHDAAYYRELAKRIREDTRLARRFLAYAEEKLRINGWQAAGELSEIEQGLYPLQGCVEREGGELKKRWQHCLADVIVMQMCAVGESVGELEDTSAILHTEH